ncbi:MAG: DUF6691 family protein [Pseudomonadota bacterium]
MSGRVLAALAAGGIFGAGLALSQMVNPLKVIAFLDVFGDWDPSLAFVMGAAVIVSFLSYRLIGARPAPLLDERWYLPTRKDIDAPLVTGAAVFGVGWGLGGYCPGPALAAVGYGVAEPAVFLLAMLAGSQLARFRGLQRTGRVTP